MSNACLYHRINELVEEVRSLKTANEELREMNTRLYNAALHESDKLLTATDKLKKAKEENTRLANENSSLKHALNGEQALRRLVVNNHPTRSFAGTVAE